MSRPIPKIVCTVTNDLSYDQRMIRICGSLSQAGYRVILIGRVLPDSIPLEQRAFEQQRLRCYFRRGKLFYLEFNLRLCWWLIRRRFDMVCAVDLDTLAPGFLISKLKGRICVYDAHEYFTEVPEVVDRPVTRWAWRLLARLIVPRLRYAYTVGPELARQLSARYGTSFAVIRNLPRRRNQAVRAPEEGRPRIILYQGRLNAGRGLETAILAMHHFPEAQLWLAGEGDLSQELRDLTEQEKLTERVRFLGYLPPATLQQLTLQAHIGLNLLENKGLSYYYSLANKTFDYIQAGLPSIQMDFPEYRALQEKYEVFVLLEKPSTDELVRELKQLLTEPDRWLRLHQNALAVRDQLCWEEEERSLLAFYRSVIE